MILADQLHAFDFFQAAMPDNNEVAEPQHAVIARTNNDMPGFKRRQHAVTPHAAHNNKFRLVFWFPKRSWRFHHTCPVASVLLRARGGVCIRRPVWSLARTDRA